MKTFNFIAAILAATALLMSSCKGNNKSEQTESKRESIELSGAGATFPQPFYNMVFELFSEQNGDQVAYGGIGSGGGVRNLKDEIVDFAGSDAFLSEKELKEMKDVIHVPTCMGAVVLAYNLPGVDSLKLSGELVAAIFSGEIKKWNDNRLKALNPNVQLPDADIIPVFRSDGSGTTYVFTDYLSKASAKWAEKYGAGKSVDFPAGQAAKGNPGVAGVISQTVNSIGYVGSEYAFAQKIPYAMMQNSNGKMVEPNAESISAAASGEIPADTRTSITNSSAPDAYPISCFTWIIIYKEQNYANRSKEQAQATVDLLKFILSDDVQKTAADVHYAPLPKKAVELSMKNLEGVTYNGKNL